MINAEAFEQPYLRQEMKPQKYEDQDSDVVIPSRIA